MKLKFWGTRGDIPAPEQDKLKYGGNTVCLELITDNDKAKIYIDAGIGLMLAGKNVPADANTFHIFLTHYHWDHIQGILPFVPFFIPKNTIHIYGYAHSEVELKDYLNTLYLYVFSPLRTIDYYAAKVYYHPLKINSELNIEGAKINTFQIEHGDYTLGLKITSSAGKSVSLIMDNEIIPGSGIHKNLLEQVKGSELLIHDCKYDDEDYFKNKRKGHSGISQVIDFAKESGIHKVGLIHYHPSYNDAKIDQMIQFANQKAPEIKTFGTREGMVIKF